MANPLSPIKTRFDSTQPRPVLMTPTGKLRVAAQHQLQLVARYNAPVALHRIATASIYTRDDLVTSDRGKLKLLGLHGYVVNATATGTVSLIEVVADTAGEEWNVIDGPAHYFTLLRFPVPPDGSFSFDGPLVSNSVGAGITLQAWTPGLDWGGPRSFWVKYDGGGAGSGMYFTSVVEPHDDTSVYDGNDAIY